MRPAFPARMRSRASGVHVGDVMTPIASTPQGGVGGRGKARVVIFLNQKLFIKYLKHEGYISSPIAETELSKGVHCIF